MTHPPPLLIFIQFTSRSWLRIKMRRSSRNVESQFRRCVTEIKIFTYSTAGMELTVNHASLF